MKLPASHLLALDAKGKPTFKYTRAAETDVAETFKRIRRQMKEAESQSSNVQSIRARKGK